MKTTKDNDPAQTDAREIAPEMVLAYLQRFKISLQIDRQELDELTQQIGAQIEQVDELIARLQQRQVSPE